MKIIEEKVEKLITQLNISSGPVLVEEIALKSNVQIKQAVSKDFSGLLFRKDGIAYMAISSNESPVRQRFTIAHELGHFFLHPQKDTFIEYRDNKYKKKVVRSTEEKEANFFAASLLMPKKFIEVDIKNIPDKIVSENDIKNLAQKYKVSEEAMTYRLINLHLVSK